MTLKLTTKEAQAIVYALNERGNALEEYAIDNAHRPQACIICSQEARELYQLAKRIHETTNKERTVNQ